MDRGTRCLDVLLQVLEQAVRDQVARDGYDVVEEKLRDFIFDREHQPTQYRRLIDWPEP